MHESKLIVYNKDIEAIAGRLRFMMIWPKSNRPEDINKMFYLKIILFYGLVFSPVLAGLLYHLFNNMKVLDMSLSQDFLFVLEGQCLLGMLFIYLCTLKTVVGNTNFYSTLDQYVTYNYDTILKVIQLVVSVAIVGGSFYKYLCKSFCLDVSPRNVAIGVCGYIIPVQYPFDFDRTPFSEVILLYQVAITLIALNITCPCVILMIFFVDKVSTNLRNVQSKAKTINEYHMSEHVVVERALKELARDHNDVIRAIRNLNSVCKYINLVHFVMASMILALLLLNVFATKNDKLDNFLQIIVWLGSVYICTRYFQTIINEGETIAVVFYEMRWYEMSLGNQKLVYVMLIAAQQPLGLHAGPFEEMSLESFLTVIKATYSYFNLLLNTL